MFLQLQKLKLESHRRLTPSRCCVPYCTTDHVLNIKSYKIESWNEPRCEKSHYLGYDCNETTVGPCLNPSCALLRSPKARCEWVLKHLRGDLKTADLCSMTVVHRGEYQPPAHNPDFIVHGPGTPQVKIRNCEKESLCVCTFLKWN